MKVGITSRCDIEEAVEKTSSILSFLKDLGTEIIVEEKTAEKTGWEKGVPLSEMEDHDLHLTIGGDGTILRVIQRLKEPIPILGVDMGDVGFLTNASPKEIKPLLSEVLDGFEVERRVRLQPALGREKLPPAVNEAVVITSEPAKILNLKVMVDGREAEKVKADGMIVATPTGSTAYAMSAGGPIVDPRVEALIIVPLAPYKLSSRPLVVPGDSKIEVELLKKGKKAKIVVDGQFKKLLKEGDVVEFGIAEKPALFVKTWKSDFYSKIRETLE